MIAEGVLMSIMFWTVDMIVFCVLIVISFFEGGEEVRCLVVALWFCNYLAEEESAGCFSEFVFLLWCDY